MTIKKAYAVGTMERFMRDNEFRNARCCGNCKYGVFDDRDEINCIHPDKNRRFLALRSNICNKFEWLERDEEIYERDWDHELAE